MSGTTRSNNHLTAHSAYRTHIDAEDRHLYMLALHAKVLVIDHDQVREAVTGDFDLQNAWRLELSEEGHVYWVSSDERLANQPAGSFMQRVEDWFFAHLLIENEM